MQVPAELRTDGLTVSFLNESGDTEKWEFGGGSWVVSSFEQVGAGKLTELEVKSKSNSIDINRIDGVSQSFEILASSTGDNVIFMPVVAGQRIKITINTPASSRLLGLFLSNEQSTSGTDNQGVYWGSIDSERIFDVTANKDYKYLLIRLWTDEVLTGVFEYQNEQKYALQEEFLDIAQKTNHVYDNIENALLQYSYSGFSQNFIGDVSDKSFTVQSFWVGGGHKIKAGEKQIYGASIYLEFESEDMHQNEGSNEVIVLLSDTEPSQNMPLKDLNILYSTSIHADKKGFYDIRFNAPYKSNGDVYIFFYGVSSPLKYVPKAETEETPFTNDFYFVKTESTIERATLQVYDMGWVLQPTIIYYTEKDALQKQVYSNYERIEEIEESLNSFGDALVNIIDKPFSFNGKKVKAYQDSFGSFVLRDDTFIIPLGITLNRNSKGGRTLTTPIGTEKQGTPNNENVLEYAMDDLTSDDYYAIIIALGTNDLGGVIRGTILLGDWDSEDTSTLYGALNYAANRCETYAPSAKVILISPINRTNGWDGTAMQIIRNAIRNKALANGFSILDGSTSPFPFVDNDLSKICWNNNDGLHPIIGIGSKMYDMWVLGNVL